MTCSVALWRCVLVLLVGLALSGCVPSAQNQADEEKEPHFIAGKNRVSAMDYAGAIESFEKALQANPRSAAAHFELGWLFEQREADPAAAIYHYQRFLRLRPESGISVVVTQRIMTCKQELARNVSLGPLTERQQREFEQLTEENKRLAERMKTLTEDVEKWRAYAARLQCMTNPSSSPTALPRGSGAASPPPAPSLAANNNSSNRVVQSPAGGAPKTHTVRAGDTFATIARKYGVRVDALMAANPGIDSRRLKVGQSLALPGS